MLSKLFSFSGKIDRRAYVLIALVGVIVKHALDRAVSIGVFHHEWTPLNYIIPLGIPIGDASASARTFLAVMVALSLPFAWVGTAITVKRFRTIGWPLWTVGFFFVPIVNVVSFGVAAAWPENAVRTQEAPPRWLMRIVPDDTLGSTLLALLLTLR